MLHDFILVLANYCRTNSVAETDAVIHDCQLLCP